MVKNRYGGQEGFLSDCSKQISLYTLQEMPKNTFFKKKGDKLKRFLYIILLFFKINDNYQDDSSILQSSN